MWVKGTSGGIAHALGNEQSFLGELDILDKHKSLAQERMRCQTSIHPSNAHLHPFHMSDSVPGAGGMESSKPWSVQSAMERFMGMERREGL